MARITPGGLKLLTRLDEPVQAAHRKQLGHLSIASADLGWTVAPIAQPGRLIFVIIYVLQRLSV
jgi:hypothetical protein